MVLGMALHLHFGRGSSEAKSDTLPIQIAAPLKKARHPEPSNTSSHLSTYSWRVEACTKARAMTLLSARA